VPDIVTDKNLLLHRIIHARSELEVEKRLLVAVAGAPGAGKSTLAEALLGELNSAGSVNCSAIVPMDGFHLDNVLLDAAGLRDVKGSPQTFDAAGLHSLLRRVAGNESPVFVPVFDRSIDLSRAAADVVNEQHRIVLVEGNYLLLDEYPWNNLAGLFDLTVFIDVPVDLLRTRLLNRWSGFGLSTEQAQHKAEANDLPNGQRVRDASIPAHIIYRQLM
jgi:pantothenate kinase